MAVAGKVAFTPMGDYDKSKAYKRLDYVRYNNATYSARKDVPVGIDITNTEYWMLNIEGGGSGGGAGIDDGKISTTTTYSSEKINTFVEEKATEINNDVDTKLDDKLDKTGDISETIASTADIPEVRTIPTVGDKFKAIFGKTIKYFQDLKTIAFTGDYEDLLNKPTIPTVTNNLLATNAGTALDAVQGKALSDKLGSTDISGIGDGTITNAISRLNSDNENARNKYKLLGSSTLSMTMAKVELADLITNYKELIFWLRNTNGRIYTSVIMPISAFKMFNSEDKSIGLEIYTSKRIYASIWYNSNTSITCVSSENNASFYWQILGMK